jgi:hypothetical protein
MRLGECRVGARFVHHARTTDGSSACQCARAPACLQGHHPPALSRRVRRRDDLVFVHRVPSSPRWGQAVNPPRSGASGPPVRHSNGDAVLAERYPTASASRESDSLQPTRRDTARDATHHSWLRHRRHRRFERRAATPPPWPLEALSGCDALTAALPGDWQRSRVDAGGNAVDARTSALRRSGSPVRCSSLSSVTTPNQHGPIYTSEALGLTRPVKGLGELIREFHGPPWTGHLPLAAGGGVATPAAVDRGSGGCKPPGSSACAGGSSAG